MSAIVKQLHDKVEDAEFEEAVASKVEANVNTASSLIDTLHKTAENAASLIVTSADTLTGWLAKLKTWESQLEAGKAAASKEYEEAVAEADRRRAEHHKKADEALASIRHTMTSLEPARANLAERV